MFTYLLTKLAWKHARKHEARAPPGTQLVASKFQTVLVLSAASERFGY